eukprot:2995024-Amphidinium_carterae.2
MITSCLRRWMSPCVIRQAASPSTPRARITKLQCSANSDSFAWGRQSVSVSASSHTIGDKMITADFFLSEPN